jgi:hypothetical protein
VLIAGCGGGYDVVCALPVALALKAAGHPVHLANYSFTDLHEATECPQVDGCLYRVGRTSEPSKTRRYFPERQLSRWWHHRFGEDQSIWAFGRQGVRPVRQAYRYLQATLDLRSVVVVDGGVDGLFIGNEHELGSPSMDAVSILSAASLSECTGVFCFTAFGTEGTAYSVRHADALRRVADLVQSKSMLGVAACIPGTAVGDDFLDAVRYIHGDTPDIWHSNMVSSIQAAMHGRFGETAVTVKTQTDRIWVSPLTLLYWFFDLEAVAAMKPYRHEVLETDSVTDVYDAIERVRQRLGVLEKSDIPI